MKPASHLNCTLLGKTVRLLVKEPFGGASRRPQSTAAIQQNEGTLHIYASTFNSSAKCSSGYVFLNTV